jgi:L-seryl-tRNA(Ser) seleniumtransferase
MDPRSRVNPDPRASLPGVDRLARDLAVERPDLPQWAIIEGARRTVGEARRAIEAATPDAPASEDWLAGAAIAAERLSGNKPRRVINATGVVLHTNLGRSPLPEGAVEHALAMASGYSDLELDLETGRRGNRLGALSDKLCLLSGAEAGHACNNNAAALMLILGTFAAGKEVIVSRGELVEIGGSFRIPEIMERAGARLVEVGTTNRTHPADYERAIGPETALLLKVHRSNFEQSGFVAEVDLAELVAIGRRHELPVVEDLGSGTLVDLTPRGFPAECYVPGRVKLGADLVCFSGDKLLGGPQAGITVGRAHLVAAMRSNPLARALRLDKLTLSLLHWTLDAVLEGRAEREIPVLRQLLQTPAELEGRANVLADRLRKLVREDQTKIEAVPERAAVGGGSLPGFRLDTWVVRVRCKRVDAVAAKLRRAPVPVIARVRDDALLLDLRTVADDDVASVEQAIEAALR